ncbi:3389_t:CDS:2, partial [Dentiscutata erythropus]
MPQEASGLLSQLVSDTNINQHFSGDILQETTDSVIFNKDQDSLSLNTEFGNDQHFSYDVLQETSNTVIIDNNQDPPSLNINNNFFLFQIGSGNDQRPSDLLILDNKQNSFDLNVDNSFTLSQNDSGSDLHDIESVNTDTEEIEVQNSASDLEFIELHLWRENAYQHKIKSIIDYVHISSFGEY